MGMSRDKIYEDGDVELGLLHDEDEDAIFDEDGEIEDF